MNLSLPPKWVEYLGLSYRNTPELFQSSDEVVDVPHAGALRDTLDKLGLAAVFCVQGVPTIAFLVQDTYDQTAVTKTHAALWNQGLASLLLVVSDNTLSAFSLARRTVRESEEEFRSRCLITTLVSVTNALALKELISGAESGRLWEQHSKYFPSQERVDNVLLGNLSESHQRLCTEGLSSEASQALLMQTMFVSYLEDRGIVTQKYILEATNNAVGSFNEILQRKKATLLTQFFKVLRRDFNGDLFVAPCSFEAAKNAPALNEKHLLILSRFHSGKEEMSAKDSQLRFWGYDFRYIPVELISAVYDRFLGERKNERRALGAYYTPMFLADTVISQVWDTLTPEIKDKGTFLDPACGSGVFLVRSFQRLCDNWRATRKNKTIRWDSLVTILERVHGWDINGSAVRVAVFSLYIALLEQVNPPDIHALIKKGRILPELWGKTLIEEDFFKASEKKKFDVVIGNPPWASRRGADQESARWCNSHGFPMPSKEAAWGFSWKALTHITPHGLIAFLLPAMGFLHNHSPNTVAARSKFIETAHIVKVINFSDLRFQLFDGAHRPAALILFKKSDMEKTPYRFEYWMPKADLNLRLKRLITLSSVDKTWLHSGEIKKDELAFKRRLWMRSPDARLFHYLDSLPKLGDIIKTHKQSQNQARDAWVIGEGFKQAVHERIQDKNYSVSKSEFVTKYPFLSVQQFHRPVLPLIKGKPWPIATVHRKGFEEGFRGSRILVPRGVKKPRLRASYTEQDLTFFSIIQTIVIPNGQRNKGKLITALLNSRVAAWFAFHGTASFGTDRPEVQKSELLRLPFPDIEILPDPKKANKAALSIVKIIDEQIVNCNKILTSENDEQEILSKIDKLAYEYFCLSKDEIAIIEDTIDYIIPAIQPHQGGFPELWGATREIDRKTYAKILAIALKEWVHDGWTVNVILEAKSADIGILRLSLVQKKEARSYQENADIPLKEMLDKLWKHVHTPLTGNFQLMPDFRVFIEGDLYLVKPMQKRFWLRSAALADADAIAADLQHVLAFNKKMG